MRTLVALDVDRYDHFRYLGPPFTEAAFDDADTNAKQWLEFAFGLDYSARALIQYTLRLAAENAASREQPWVEAAALADLSAEPENSVIRFVLGEDADEAEAARDAQQKIMRERIARLEGFARLADQVVAGLRAQLELDIRDGLGRSDHPSDNQP